MSKKRSLWPVPALPPSQADRSESHSADPFEPQSEGRAYSAGIPQPANSRGHFGRFVIVSLCAVAVFFWALFYFTFGSGRRVVCGPNLSDEPVSQQVTQTMAAQVRAALSTAKLQGTITDVKALHYSASFCDYDKSLLVDFTYRQSLAGQTVSVRMQIGGVDRYPGRWHDDGRYDQKDAGESLVDAVLDNAAHWTADDEVDFPPPPEFKTDQSRLVSQATAALNRLPVPGYRFKEIRIIRVFPGGDGVSRLEAIAKANRQSGQPEREQLGGYYYLTAAQRMSVFGMHIDVAYQGSQGSQGSSEVDQLAAILKRQRTDLAAGQYFFEFPQSAADESCPDCYTYGGEIATSVSDGRFSIDDISH